MDQFGQVYVLIEEININIINILARYPGLARLLLRESPDPTRKKPFTTLKRREVEHDVLRREPEPDG
jgi:hypothetical protein